MSVLSNRNGIYTDINEGIDLVKTLLDEYEDEILQSAGVLLKEKKLHLIQSQVALAEKVKNFRVKFEELKNEWNNDFQNIEVASSNIIEEREGNLGVHDRTNWWISDGTIKIETKRMEGSPYSNVIPIELFQEIAKTAVEFLYRRKFVKTSDVLKLLQDDIVANSDYKKTPRIPVYATFKVLVKEKLLKVDDNNSHKYIAVTSKDNFLKWIDNIKKAIN